MGLGQRERRQNGMAIACVPDWLCSSIAALIRKRESPSPGEHSHSKWDGILQGDQSTIYCRLSLLEYAQLEYDSTAGVELQQHYFSV